MSAAGRPAPRSATAGVLSWLTSLFTLKPEQFHPALGLIIAAVMLVPLAVLTAVGRADLWLSFSFGVLFTGVSDLVVKDAYATRVRWSVGVVLVGAVLTVLGYVLGGANWALVALAVLVTTLLSYSVTASGRRGAVAGVLLNIWFLITLSVTHALDKSPAQTWAPAGPQALTAIE